METFVVRLWVPQEEDTAGREDSPLRGVVEHVRSGTAEAFRCGPELEERLREMAGATGPGEEVMRPTTAK